MTHNLDAALYYATALGWHVLPVWPTVGPVCACPLGVGCGDNAGKHPLADLVPTGLAMATRDPDRVRAWWTARPDAHVAVAMRASGLVAFDVDLYKGDAERLQALVARIGALPVTVEQRSGSGEGVHLIYRSPQFDVRGAIDGVTMRSRNYLVVAPSGHRRGAGYRWEDGRAPGQVPVAELPPAWLEALRKPEASGAAGVPPEAEEPAWLRAIPHADRVAAMRAHLAREPGEVKGQSPPSMCFNVARIAARGYAVRDPDEVVAAMCDVYDAKCAPPYGRARIVERVANAYIKATEPAWGWCHRPSPTAELGAGAAGAEGLRPLTLDGGGPPPRALTRGPARYLRGAALVAKIASRAGLPWIDVRLGFHVLVQVRVGGIILLIGGSGAGKSSLAVSLLLDHGRDRGPAIAMSLELPDDEMAARGAAIECGATWAQILKGEVGARLPERFAVLDRDHATLEELELAIDEMAAAYPGEPILVVVDYVQLMHSAERDTRSKVADAMRRIDATARRKNVVVIALSQGSRASARSLGTGEKLGAETADAGAEAAELERWSTVTLAIGEAREREDGSRDVDLSIGKWRMGKGDAVVPMVFNGATGRWEIVGPAKSAKDVREQRGTEGEKGKADALVVLIRTILDRSARPMTRQEIAKVLERRKADVSDAIVAALGDPSSNIVEAGFIQGGARPCWTRARLEAANAVANAGTGGPPGMPLPVLGASQ